LDELISAAEILRLKRERDEAIAKRIEANNQWRLDYNALCDERDSLRADLAEAREALEPFAEFRRRGASEDPREWPRPISFESWDRAASVHAKLKQTDGKETT
jgi:hypothetical protein